MLLLESENALYYRFHKEQCDCFSSQSIIVSPNVEVFRSSDNDLLPYTFSVAVLTCAAPILDGVRKKTYSYEEYTALLYERIMGILSVCEKMRYRKLVLGAWCCGAFGNDPTLMASIFEKAMNQFECAFDEIQFAIFGGGANFECFHRFMVLKEIEI